MNILVVDDEQIVLDSVRKLLRKDNYEIHCAHTAPQALEMIEQVPVDIILTDLMMPEMDGLELMRVIKTRRPQVPVIMITGYATINTALQATQLGAFDYIAKPFSRKELQGVVRRAADLVRATEAGPESATTGTASTGTPQVAELFKAVGDNTWMVLEEAGIVLLGVEHSFLTTIGRIQALYLPNIGDEVRQGGVYAQFFSADLRSHTVLSPLSGTVVEVNQQVLDDPATTLQDPYGDGWLIRLKPSRFEQESGEFGL